jgi:tRNA(Leu) C34 or U34 (ribose-2'-O)-methylase TrmL
VTAGSSGPVEYDPDADLDDALYDSDPVVRDAARGRVAERAEPRTVDTLVRALDAAHRSTRRRAGRILAEMRPERTRARLADAVLNAETHAERLRAGAARALALLGGVDEPALGQALRNDPSPRVRRACASHATPAEALLAGLRDSAPEVVEACVEALSARALPLPEADRAALAERFGTTLAAFTRLLARSSPTSPETCAAARAGDASALDHLAHAPTWRALLEGPHRVAAAWALVTYAPDALAALSRDADPAVRAAAVRAVGRADPAILAAALVDPDPTVRWHARRVAAGDFESLDDRIAPHARSDAPSARPPYGLNGPTLPATPPRVPAALALCHNRLDVNLGVAVRSAEACGLEEVVLVGRGELLRTAARGTERVLPVRAVPDAEALLREARARGRQLVVVQQTPRSVPYHRAEYPPTPLFVLGAEDDGVPAVLRRAADLLVEIPMWGVIDSLNVATAATCVLFHWRAHRDA